MLLPSKELMSEVLGLTVYSSKKVAKTSIVRYKFDAIGEVGDSSISIYELAHKCKEWAIGKNWRIDSSVSIDLLGQAIVYHITERLIPSKRIYNQDTELEAIFKACEWVSKIIRIENDG